MREIIAVARRKGKTISGFADTLPQLHHWIEAGVQHIACSIDLGLFTTVCRDTVAATGLRALLEAWLG